MYSLLAGLAGPIFDGGRLAAERDGAQARREELLAGYYKSIVAAYGDVDLALNAVYGLKAQAEAQAEVLAQARQAVSLAELRYKAGAESLLSLLQAQTTLYAAQDDAVLQRLLQLQARVALYRALGGDGRRLPWALKCRKGRRKKPGGIATWLRGRARPPPGPAGCAA